MKLASMANYQQAGIIAVEYDTETETGSAYTIIDGVKEDLPGGPVQHNAAGHLATEANYGGDLVSAQYDASSGSGAASAVVGGEDIVIVGEAGSGILSITISPAITTTPALESVFPIYWEDLTEEERQDGVSVALTALNLPAGDYTVTVAPTDDWYVRVGQTAGTEKGSPVSEQFSVGSGDPFALLPNMFAFSNISEEEPDKMVFVQVSIGIQ